MQRSQHIARDVVANVRILASNFYVDNTLTEKGPGAVMTVSASVEYPAGVFTQILFSGSADGTIPDGGVLLSDVATVVIPTGATFWIRQWLRCTGGMIVSSQITIAGDRMVRGVSGIADQTMGGTIGSGTAAALNFPLAIIGTMTQPSVLLLGDSVAQGLGMAPDANGERGFIMKISPSFGHVNLAMPTMDLAAYAASNTQRKMAYQYCSHFINELGIGDLFHGDSVAQLETKLTTLYNSFVAASASGKVFQTTYPPQTITTDACTTLVNQTFRALETNRLAFNDILRAGTFLPNAGMFDVDLPVSTGGKWPVTPSQYSFDCAHPSTLGNSEAIAMIDISRITR